MRPEYNLLLQNRVFRTFADSEKLNSKRDSESDGVGYPCGRFTCFLGLFWLHYAPITACLISHECASFQAPLFFQNLE